MITIMLYFFIKLFLFFLEVHLSNYYYGYLRV